MIAATIITYISFVNSMMLSQQVINNLFNFFKLYFFALILYVYGFKAILDSLEALIVGGMIFDFFRDF